MRRLRIGPLALTLAVIALGALVVAQQDQDDSSRASAFFEEFTADPYTDWAFEPNVPDGYYVGVEPHGMILRTFINDVVEADLRDGDRLVQAGFSDGAAIMKENHMPGDLDISEMELQAPVENFEGNLAALTFMVKIEGYNPEAGDWFWAKMTPDGGIDAAGKPEGCIACHGQVAEQDYIFNIPKTNDD